MANSGLPTNGEALFASANTRPDEANSSRRYPVRMALIGFGMFTIVAAGLIALVQLLAAERIPKVTEASIEQAEELWNQVSLQNYDLDLELSGAQPGDVRVQVRNGEVAAMTRDGRIPPPRTWHYWSVPGLFETIERDMDIAEDPVHEASASTGTQWQLRCEFDAQYGFPRRYHRTVSGGGPEVYWKVTRFEPQR